jgi:hypothetical protein
VKTFTVQVEEWVKKVDGLLEAVFQQATQDLFDHIRTPVKKGGNMPVITSFLRNSFVVTLNAPSTNITFNIDGSVSIEASYSVVIAGATVEDTIYGVFTANYAGYVHYGTGGRQGRLFIDLAVQRWQQIVDDVVASLKD